MSAPVQDFSAIGLQTLPAWGGAVGTARIRVRPEDFQVFEIPLLTPCGEGEHCWLRVRKRNSNTRWVAGQLAGFAAVARSAVSYAGLKDRHAVTEQWFSVQLPGRSDPDWRALQHDDFEVLEARRHRRKLKIGALQGNRFRLYLRDVDADREALEARLDRLRRGGFPNYFGPQRFGLDGANLESAARLFQRPGRRSAGDKRGIYLSAVRAALFNRVLASRVEAGSWNRVVPGDALMLDGRSACFVADTPDSETLRRAEALEIHPTGPLCGDGAALCRGEALAFETKVLADYEDWLEGLCRMRVEAARRALRVVARELRWSEQETGVWVLEFALPAGSFATSLLAEVLAVEGAD
ncbi:MAG: tRNA pseudouridine(13) synthase TruD [Gammaproteobacteria bacterium]